MDEKKKKARSYTTEIQKEIIDSRKVAWVVATVAVIVAVIAVIAVVLLVPLKTVVPYVIKENTTTGETRIITALDTKTLQIDEAVDKFSTSNYVKKREEYYYDLIAKDYYEVMLSSSPPVQKEYAKIYTGKQSRDKLLGKNFKVKTTILSVVLGTSSSIKTATIRSKSVTIDRETGIESNEVYHVHTLSYEFDGNRDMIEKDRLINPLGFMVLTYRRDREVK